MLFPVKGMLFGSLGLEFYRSADDGGGETVSNGVSVVLYGDD